MPIRNKSGNLLNAPRIKKDRLGIRKRENANGGCVKIDATN